MTSDLDIFRSASVLIREHSAGAALEAAQRADALLERGDMEGAAVWKRLCCGLDLARPYQGPNQSVNR